MTPYLLSFCQHPREAAAIHYFSTPHVECVDAADTIGFSKLASASAVIFSRDLFAMQAWVEAVRAADVPRYYFMDENVVTMRDEPQYHTHAFHRHSKEDVRAQLEDFNGVLVSNNALAEYVRRTNLHSNVAVLPPAATQLPYETGGHILDQITQKSPRVIRFAFFSAPIRQGFFAQIVLPALRELSHDFNVELIAFGCAPGSLDDVASPLRVRTPAWNLNYTEAMAELRRWNPDVILQPEIINQSTPYKMPHMLLTAAQLGAALITSNAAPYIELARQMPPPVLLCPNTVSGWAETMRMLLESPPLRQRCAQAALNCVRTTWDGSANAALTGLLVARHPTPSDAIALRRNKSLFVAANSWFGRSWALAHASRELLGDKILQTEKNERDLTELRSALTDSRARLVQCENSSL